MALDGPFCPRTRASDTGVWRLIRLSSSPSQILSIGLVSRGNYESMSVVRNDQELDSVIACGTGRWKFGASRSFCCWRRSLGTAVLLPHRVHDCPSQVFAVLRECDGVSESATVPSAPPRVKSKWAPYRLFPTAYPRHPCTPSLSGPLPHPVVVAWRAVAPASPLPSTQNTPGRSHPKRQPKKKVTACGKGTPSPHTPEPPTCCASIPIPPA